MTIKLLNDDSKVTRVIPLVFSFLVYANGDLLVTFNDLSETRVKKTEFCGFYVLGRNL